MNIILFLVFQSVFFFFIDSRVSFVGFLGNSSQGNSQGCFNTSSSLLVIASRLSHPCPWVIMMAMMMTMIRSDGKLTQFCLCKSTNIEKIYILDFVQNSGCWMSNNGTNKLKPVFYLLAIFLPYPV